MAEVKNGAMAEPTVAQLIEHPDFASLALGAPAGWPAELRQAMAMVLPAQAEIVLFWGDDYIALYNDAYAPTIGDKHPMALGRSARQYWAELWDDLGPLLDNVRRTGETFAAKDRAFYIERHGHGEEVFFDISYSAIRNAQGQVDGVLCIVSETTQRVRAERAVRDDLQRLTALFGQAPGFMAVLDGPNHVFRLTNAAYQQLIGHRDVIAQPIRQALPELEGQGFYELLDGVFASGEPFVGKAMPVGLQMEPGQANEDRLLDFVYQPIRDQNGHVTGIFVQGSDVTDRARTEHELAQISESLSLATQAAAIGVWDCDPRTGELRWDPQCRAIFEVASDAPMTLELFYGRVAPADRDRVRAEVEAALEPSGSGHYDIEYRAALPSGQDRWVAAKGSTMFADGVAVRFVGTVVDISERRAAEEALAEESRALEILNRTAAEVAAELDLDRLVQTVVEAGVALSGAQFGAFFYNVVDPRGESYLLYGLAGADRSAFSRFPMPRSTAVFAPTFNGEGLVRSDDITRDPRYGQNAPLKGMPPGHLPVRSYLAVPVVSRSGEVIGALMFGHEEPGIFNERAERLISGLASHAAVGIDNARLFQSVQRYADDMEAQVAERTAERDQIWQVSQDLLGVADRDGIWRSVNPAWTRVLGWQGTDIEGRTSEWMEHPDDRAATRAEVARLAQGYPTVAFENRFRTRTGEYRTLSWRAVPLGEAIYCVARDVTEQRQQAEALSQTEEQLRQAQKMEMVGQLTGGIAHDFNNLLQIVSGNLETIQRGLPEDAARLRRAAGNALTGAERAAVLTQRLLAFSRRQPLDPRPVDVNRLVSGMSELVHRSLGETVEVETVLAPGLWTTEVDPNQLEMGLLNLCVNARDAMPQGGRLTIETANVHLDHDYVAQHAEVAVGQYVQVSVSDTGQGMDEATLERVFEPFFTTKDVGKGTGLGLSMVYGFVKQSGGHVKIYSELGHGTTVRIYLPRLIGGDVAEPESQAQLVPEAARDECVLVCEDDPGVRTYTVDLLQELGYRVIEAADGAAALAVLKGEEKVDLLFTDVVLPGGMSGAEVARQASIARPGLHVLFTTGYARNAIVHHGRLDHGVELITKPFSYSDLAARIRDLLDRR